MAYRFSRCDASIEKGVRRIGIEQIDRAIERIDSPAQGLPETVHDVRKRCKKLRGLIRLVRPVFPGYSKENAAIRDAMRMLSHLRDSDVLIDTYGKLIDAHGNHLDDPERSAIRSRIAGPESGAEYEHLASGRLVEMRATLVGLRKRARKWRLKQDGFAALAGGLKNTYRRARRGMHLARDTGVEDAFHDWRKSVRYHGHHTRLLVPIWPDALAIRNAATDSLAELLGDHHDLAVFETTMAADPTTFGANGDVATILSHADDKRLLMEQNACAVGARLFAEQPAAFVARWQRYWDIWRAECAADQP